MMIDFNDTLEKIIVAVGGGILTWLTWITKRISNFPARAEVVEMVKAHSPYVQDKSAINHQLRELKDACDKLDEHLDAQSAAMGVVSQEITRIRTILDERARPM